MNQLDGIAYTVRSISDMAMGVPGGAHHSEWMSEAVVAAGRGRMQFVTCSLNTFFEAGDYALFDDSSSIIVKPEQKTFSMPAFRPSTRRAAARVSATVNDLQWVIDTLDDRQTVAGIPTAHYRVTVTYSMNIDSPLREEISEDELTHPTVCSTVDQWYARIDGLPAHAAFPFPPRHAGGTQAARELRSMWALVAAQLAPNGTPLKSRSVIEVRNGAVANLTTSETEISDVRPLKVDEAALVLPHDFTELIADMSAGVSPPDNDAAIRWRTPPTR